MTQHDRQVAPSYPLREHGLDFIKDLRVGEELLTLRFARGCSMHNCSALCCSEGVLIDIKHRDRVLAEAPLVIEYMDATQDHDPAHWFEPDEYDDPDFPSGFTCNTRVVDKRCVFLDAERRCVLHRAEERSPGLKPFYCRTYPVVVVDARLTLDDEHCPNETQCCGVVDGGELTALDVCAWELEFTLGEKGMRELRQLAELPPDRRPG